LQGHTSEAYHSYQRAHQLAPQDPEPLNNLGLLCYQLGKTQEALNYLTLLARQDASGMGWYNLASVYRQLKQPDQALQALSHIPPAFPIDLKPLQVDLSYACGDTAQTLKLLGELRKAYPEDDRLYFASARLSLNLHQLQAASAYFRQGLALCQSPQEYDRLMAHIAPQEHDNLAILNSWCQEAWNRWHRPIDLYRLIQVQPPAVCESSTVIQLQRQYLADLLSHAHTMSFQDIPPFYEQAHFYLAYHAENDRELNQAISAVRRRAIPPTTHPLAPRLPGERLRIGWISSHLFDHSVMHCFKATITTMIANPDLEVGIFSIQEGQAQDLGANYIQRHWPPPPAHLQTFIHETPENIALGIAAWQPHVIIYPEIGMNPLMSLLAEHRLAALQLLLPGHPITSGIPTIDAFVSQAIMEPPEAQNHYSEKLIALPGVVHYQRPAFDGPAFSRAELGLPDQAVYLCPMMPFKLHPDFDPIIAEILRRDPEGTFWLPQLNKPFETLLHQRLKAHLGPLASRLHFFRWMSQAQFLSLLWHAEVSLDPTHFGAGNTGYIAASVGVPLISWPGAFFRNRAMLGLYQLMGFSDCLANNQEEYLQLAYRMAHDAEWRAQMRAEVQTRSHRIFEIDTWNQGLVDVCRHPERYGLQAPIA
jgi:protein O-GlcNAc transferase